MIVTDCTMKPSSCDTFAALPPGTKQDCIVFGKNSDRPCDEVQEVIYVSATDHGMPSKLKCTYIEIDQVAHTHAVILSKPAWMWGAEMGANEHGVCIGNEAVWTKLCSDSDADEKLLGMDLLRLGLERSSTAIEALKIIVSLIETYGMGGNCSETFKDFTYHNSFLIADPSEVWILECAGSVWAAENIKRGFRNISNELSITTNIDLMSDNLEEFAKDKGFWHPNNGSFNFKKAFGLEEDEFESHRYRCGKRLLATSCNGSFCETDMIKILRDKPSGICMSSGSFVSTGSQVSVLRKQGSGAISCHWFTATPDPSRSVFKPFVFTENIRFPPEVFQDNQSNNRRPSSRKHELYKMHENFYEREECTLGVLLDQVNKLESKYLLLAESIAKETQFLNESAAGLFKDAVKDELQLYSGSDMQ